MATDQGRRTADARERPDRAQPPGRAEPSGRVLPFPRSPRDAPAEHVGDPRLRDVLGAELRDERRRQGRTLADVAAGASVSLAYLSEVERGRKDVSSELLASICDALALPLPDLLERSADRVRRVRVQRGTRFQLLAA